MNQDQRTPIPIHLKVNVIPATRKDFISGGHVMFGEIFYLKRKTDGEFEGPYTLQPHHTNIPKGHTTSDFADWLQANMVYRREIGQPVKISTK